MKDNNGKSVFKTKFKQILFLLIVLVVAQVAILVISEGKINSLEGYLYSFAATATEANATSCNATSGNAQTPNATSCNATSSNVQMPNFTGYNATSGNAQMPNATSCNATSNNAQMPNATGCNATSSNAQMTNATNYNSVNGNVSTLNTTQNDGINSNVTNNNKQDSNLVPQKESVEENSLQGVTGNLQNNEKKEVVSFLESHRTYISILGVCVLAIILVSIIIILDKKGIEKRHLKNNSSDNTMKKEFNDDNK